MTKAVYLLGGGGHAKTVLDTLLQMRLTVAGVLDARLEKGDSLLGIRVLGCDEYLEGLDSGNIQLVNGIGANPHVGVRRNLFERLKARGFQFQNALHPSVLQGQGVELSEGCQVLLGAVLQQGVRVGANGVINTGARIDHDCRIGDHAFVAPGAILCGNVEVQQEAFIGAGAVLLPGVRIGRRAIVGAGAVVTKPVPDGWVVVGNPARKMGENKC